MILSVPSCFERARCGWVWFDLVGWLVVVYSSNIVQQQYDGPGSHVHGLHAAWPVFVFFAYRAYF